MLIPALCGPPSATPATSYPAAGLPALERLLSRSRVEDWPALDAEHALGGFFQMSDGDGASLAVAPLTWLADSGERAPGFIMRADPVHLRADQARLRLFDSTTFAIDAQEARDLVSAFNDYYRGQGRHLDAPLPQRWYLTLGEAPAVATVAPMRLAGRDIKDGLPHGEGGAAWHAFLNDVQMLFHDHPVNQARERRGVPVINSIWPWGGGCLPRRVSTAVTHAFAGHPLLQGLARLAGIPCLGLPENATDLPVDSRGGIILVMLDRLEPLCRYGDAQSWADAITRLEQAWFGPLLGMLEQGRIARLDLYPVNGKRYAIGRWRLRQIWKRDRSLAWHCGHGG